MRRVTKNERVRVALTLNGRKLAADAEAVHQSGGRNSEQASTEALIDLCHVLFNCNEFMFVD